MEKCLNYLHVKSFNTYNIVLLILFELVGIVVIWVSSSSDFYTSFKCYDKDISKTKEPSLIETINTKCAHQYQEKFLFTLPISVIFAFNFGTVFAVSFIYGCLVKGRVKKFDHPTRMTTSNNDSDETTQVMLPFSNPGQNNRDVRTSLGRFSTFFIYVVHLLLARVIPMLGFAVWMFCQADFPKSFPCSLGPELQRKGTSKCNVIVSSRSNLTCIDCTNYISQKSKNLVYFVASVNVCLMILSLLELSYIVKLACKDHYFIDDQEFCEVYLLRNRKRIRKEINKIRDKFDEEVLQSKYNFDSTSTKISLRPLKDIYVNVVIQEGSQSLNVYQRKKHEIYEPNVKIPSSATKLGNTAVIFKPTENKDGPQKYPRTILVLGRPGIGKTTLTKKILQQWKTLEDDFWHEKIVILLQFRAFYEKNSKKEEAGPVRVSFCEMLKCSVGLTQNSINTVFQIILLYPTKTVLIFDGLDERIVDDDHVEGEVMKVINWNEKMPVFTIFKQLLCGKFLPGVTVVVTTSRPTAQRVFWNMNFERTVEILGFFEEQIREYVKKFCKDDNISELIWKEIQGSAEMRSLCYIPVNSYIVCLTLKESIESDSDFHAGLSSNIVGSITELYKRAVKVLLYRHHPRYRSIPKPSDYLTSPFPEELENELMKLKEIAESEISKNKLIFDRPTGDEFATLANSGFFHQLPDKRRNLFCFLHLTLQEFLAASKVVDDMDKVVQFLDDHIKDPKWHLVIQFVAGLVGDKIRKNPEEYKNQQAAIQKRLEEWALLLGKKENEIALLAIKCLYEQQDIDIMKSVSGKFLPNERGCLELHRLNISGVDSTALFTFLGNRKNIETLEFGGCTIQENCYYDFKSLLSTEGNTITSFTCHAGLTNAVVKYLSEALKSKDCKLTKLNLGGNKITDEGVEYISEALETETCNLTELNLGRNDIKDKGVEYLSKALKNKNCKIKKLYLDGNKITDQGFKYLRKALESENCQVTKLHLYNNEITHQSGKCLNIKRSKDSLLAILWHNVNDDKINEGVKHLREPLKSEDFELC